MRIETLHLYGPGRAAVSVAAIAHRCGHRIASISGGSEGSRRSASALLAGSRIEVEPDAVAGEILILGVPDDALAEVASELGARGGSLEGVLAIHLSGIHPPSLLTPLKERGARIGAWHPLRSFAERGGTQDLEGCAVAVAAEDSSDRGRLFRLAELLGGQPFLLEDGERGHYHLAASLVAGGVLALLRLGVGALEQAGVPSKLARDGLVALGKGALDNASRLGESDALTGPVVRGDIRTLGIHDRAADALGSEERDLYEAILSCLLRLSVERGEAEASKRVETWLSQRGE